MYKHTTDLKINKKTKLQLAFARSRDELLVQMPVLLPINNLPAKLFSALCSAGWAAHRAPSCHVTEEEDESHIDSSN